MTTVDGLRRLAAAARGGLGRLGKPAIIAIFAAAALAACATTPERSASEAEALQEAAVTFLGMAPIEEAAAEGRMVVRLFTVDENYWPVVEFVAQPSGGPVEVSVTNVPGNFGARRISAEVDPEIWALLLEDLQTLKTAPAVDAQQTLTVDVTAAGAPDVEAVMVCSPVSWFVLAEGGEVSTPGMPSWESCANRQGAMIPGLYGLALHSLAPCNLLEPQMLDVSGVARCLRISGRRDVAVELANAVSAARAERGEAEDDFAVILSRFGPQARFQIASDVQGSGEAALLEGWRKLAPGQDIKIGLSTYKGLSDTEAEISGEAYYTVNTDSAGRMLPVNQWQMWYADFRQLWVKGEDGWTIQEFAIERPRLSNATDPLQRYLDGIPLSNSVRR